MRATHSDPIGASDRHIWESCTDPSCGLCGPVSDKDGPVVRAETAKPKGCKHRWTPFTIHKARCSRCGRRVPWADIVTDAEDRGWILGLGYAVAEVVRLHDQPGVAAEVVAVAGCDLGDFVTAGLDTYDLKTLRRVAKEEERRWPQRKSSNR